MCKTKMHILKEDERIPPSWDVTRTKTSEVSPYKYFKNVIVPAFVRSMGPKAEFIQSWWEE